MLTVFVCGTRSIIVPALGALIGAALTSTARAEEIRWRTDGAAAAKEAREKNLPLFIFIPAGKDLRREADNWNDAAEKVQQNPAVVQTLNQRFIPTRLQRTNENAKIFKELGIDAGRGLKAAMATGDGKKLEDLSAGDLGRLAVVRDTLTQAFRKFRNLYYDAELQPILTDVAPANQALLKALGEVQRLVILKAQGDVINLLTRALNDTVRKAVYQTLSVLSMPDGTRALLGRAADKDTEAVRALRQCTSGVADVLAAEMNEDYDERHVAAYEAVCAILKEPNTKQQAFWTGMVAREKKKELDRIRRVATQRAEAWRKDNDAFR